MTNPQPTTMKTTIHEIARYFVNLVKRAWEVREVRSALMTNLIRILGVSVPGGALLILIVEAIIPAL